MEYKELDTEKAFRSLDWLREQVENQINEERESRRKARNKRKARVRAEKNRKRKRG